MASVRPPIPPPEIKTLGFPLASNSSKSKEGTGWICLWKAIIWCLWAWRTQGGKWEMDEKWEMNEETNSDEFHHNLERLLTHLLCMFLLICYLCAAVWHWETLVKEWGLSLWAKKKKKSRRTPPLIVLCSIISRNNGSKKWLLGISMRHQQVGCCQEKALLIANDSTHSSFPVAECRRKRMTLKINVYY